MHELGVLGRFIPEFDALTCLVQHEFYHRYTADIHTLNAIRELDLIFTEAEPIKLKYRSVLHEVEDPALVYLTLLLHDIGKAEGIQNHSEAGVRLAGPIMERLGVSARGRELVSFVIKNHLAMARFWQKRDVDDPKTSAQLCGAGRRPRAPPVPLCAHLLRLPAGPPRTSGTATRTPFTPPFTATLSSA